MMKLLVSVVGLSLILLPNPTFCHEQNNDEFEFGRKTLAASNGRKLHKSEILLRELIDKDITPFSMSMSMSMSMPRDPYPLAPPTLPTPAKPPTQAISPSPSSSVGMEESTDDEVGVPVMPSPAPQNGVTEIVVCYGEYEMLVTFNMEVETRFGKVSFSDEVATALKEALSTEFTVCETPSRRKRRLVETPISIGSVRVLDSAGTCVVQADQADQCRLARAEILVFSDNDQDVAVVISNSVQAILTADKAFDDELMMDDIVDVRLRGDTSTSPNAAVQASEAGSPSGSPATTAVVTVAATGAIVLAALALKRSRRKSGYDSLDDAKDCSIGESYADTAPATVSGVTI